MSDGKDTENQTEESQKSGFRDKLKESGRLVPIKSTAKHEGTFVAIALKGKPLSEIVIEDEVVADYFFDTSAIVKRYAWEPGSDRVARIVRIKPTMYTC